MKLVDLVNSHQIKKFLHVDDLSGIEVTGVAASSKEVHPGYVFIATPGHAVDGRKFIPDAIEKGAVAVVSEDSGFDEGVFQGQVVPTVLVDNLRLQKAYLARDFYLGNKEISAAIAVTGTNGKTSVCWILSQALTYLKNPCSYVGTLGMFYYPTYSELSNGYVVHTNNTTPDPIELYSFLGEASNQGAKALAMEVTSVALDQERAAGLNWTCAVLTNITRDHLDYHKTFERYVDAKKKLFAHELLISKQAPKFVVINRDDQYGAEIISWIKENAPEIKIIDFSSKAKASACLKEYKPSHKKTDLKFEINNELVSFESKLVGGFNATNMLTSAAVLYGLGYKTNEIEGALSKVSPVPGRLQRVNDRSRITVLVDYAHTPDALVRAQESVRELTTGRIITVFGCGGDRDRGKRPEMAREVARLSDYAIITSDNPRTEDPQRILDDVVAGMPKQGDGISYRVEIDRRKAIREAIREAKPCDVVLIAGKGHEDYQEINGVKHHFSDVEVANEELSKLGLGA